MNNRYDIVVVGGGALPHSTYRKKGKELPIEDLRLKHKDTKNTKINRDISLGDFVPLW